MFRAACIPTVLLLALSLQGCLTRELWRDDPVTPPLHTVAVPCRVHEVTVPADEAPHAIGLRFSVAPSARTPRHLWGYTAEQPGYLDLRPPPGRSGDWRGLPGAGLFAPSSWELRLTAGSYFKRPGAHARLVFHGVLHPEDVGELLEAEQLPAELRELTADLSAETERWSWAEQCLRGFRTHRWEQLLAATPPNERYRAVPVAWVDAELREVGRPGVPSGRLEDYERAREALARYRLLGRLEGDYGDVQWVLVPAPVLLQGDDLELRRDGDVVRWSRQQLWTGHIARVAPDPARRLPWTLPLRGQGFEYRWSREVPEGTPVLVTVGRVLATPVTAVLDVLIMTNPYLANLLPDRSRKPIEEPERRN